VKFGKGIDVSLPTALGLAQLVLRHPAYLGHLVRRKMSFWNRYRWVMNHPDSDGAVPLPLVYKLVLTYQCNLRCPNCYQWGENGWCKKELPGDMRKELDFRIVEKIFRETGKIRPSFILIGGEPLLYHRFSDLASRLEKEKCFATVCTNGYWMDRFAKEFDRNPYLTLLVSLDGLEDANDKLRGEGVYKKVAGNIANIKRLANPPYVGIEFTVYPENVHNMYDFCEEMVKLRVDWIIFNPRWFISPEQARAYEEVMQNEFKVKPKTHLAFAREYPLNREMFAQQMEKIRSKKWPIQISCYLRNLEEVKDFIDCPQGPSRNSFCYKQWLRLDINPDGKIVPCFLYPDITFGDMNAFSVYGSWNSEDYRRFREFCRKKLLPVCGKCPVLYLYDPRRKVL